MAKGWIAAGVALVLALTMWYYVGGVLIPYQQAEAAGSDRPRGNLSDLYPRWLGSRELLLHGRDPYSAAVTREIQVGYYGRPIDPARPHDPKDQQGFAYPVYVAFLLAPTLGLDFSVVQAGFTWLLLALTAAGVPLWMYAVGWRPGMPIMLATVLLTLGSFPVVQGIALQQLSLLVGVLLAGAAAALVAGRPALAGVLLALATIKPQVAAPLAAWLALWTISDWRRRQGLAWGFGATMALLLVGAEIASPGWIGRFRDALAAYQQYTDGRSLLATLLTPIGGTVATVLLLALTALVCWRVRRDPAGTSGFALALALVPAVTLTIIPTWAPYNQVLLLPGLFLLAAARDRIWARGRAARYCYLLAWGLVAWPWVATAALAAAALVLPAATVQSAWTLPLYTSLLIPLGALLALGFPARQALPIRQGDRPA
jgi:hypothetical protein